VPRPDAETLLRYYADTYFQEESATFVASYSEAEHAYPQLGIDHLLYALDRAGASAGPEGNLLEVGCGEGFFLRTALERGWDAHGVEMGRYAVERFNPDVAPRVREADAVTALEADHAAGMSYAVVVLAGVLEHVLDARLVLELVRLVLRPDGLLAVTVPNDDSLVQRRLQELGHADTRWFVPPEHLNYFNVDTGPAFARAVGFEVLDVYADFPIDWFGFHPGSNYFADAALGPAAHRARVELEHLHASRGPEAKHPLAQGLAACGSGRAFTMLLRP